jgi:hypothetical protein
MKDCLYKLIYSGGLKFLMHLFIYWALDGIILLLKLILSGMNTKNELNGSKSLEWIYSFCIIFADISGVIFKFFFEKKSDKNLKSSIRLESLAEISINKYSLNPIEHGKDHKINILLLVSSVLEFLLRISDLVYMIVLVRRIYPIGMIFLFSFDIICRYLLFIFAAFKEKENLNTFTVISMSITFLGGIYFFFVNRRYYIIEYLHYIALTVLKLLIVPLRDVINDYLLSKKEIEPSKIMFFRGIVNLILMLIMSLLIFFFNLIEYFSFFNDGVSLLMFIKIGLFLLIVILSIGKFYNLLLTIKDYTSFHAVFSYLFLYIFKYIENREDTEESFHLNDEDVANIYYILFVVFLILVYCEIIKIDFGDENKRDIEMEDYENEEIEEGGEGDNKDLKDDNNIKNLN